MAEQRQHELQASQLALLLPGGLDLLPDIYAEVPVWLRPWIVLGRPRSYMALLDHIALHYEWYVRRDLRELARRLHYNMRTDTFAVAAVLGLVLTAAAGLEHPVMLGLGLLILLLLGPVAFAMLTYRRGLQTQVHDNKAELYLYLRRAYSDAE
jgi:hypothetical protein